MSTRPSEPYHTYAVWAAGEIAKRTSNRYTMDVFPASQLGNETQINQSLSLGTVDMIYTGQAFAARTYPPLSIGGAPYMFRDFDHWKNTRTSPVLAELMDGYFKKGGNKPIAAFYYGVRHTTANKAINKPEDMKGLKLRVPDAPLYIMYPKMRRRERHADRLRRGLPRAAEQDRGRAGEPAADHPGEEVLRGADARQPDRPHHRDAARHRRRPRLEQAVRRRQEGLRGGVQGSGGEVQCRDRRVRAGAGDRFRHQVRQDGGEVRPRGVQEGRSRRSSSRKDVPWDKALYDRVQAIK